MHIVFLTRRFYPDIGGVEKHVLEISKRLSDKGFTTTIITESQLSSHKEFTYKNIGIIRFTAGKNDWFKKFRIWSELWKTKQLFQHADIVHCHDVFFWYLLFRFLFPYKPVYTTFHGYESFPIRTGARMMRKVSEKLSWGNICIGDFIQKWYGTRPDCVTYGGVEIPNSKFQIPYKQKKESAVFIGRLDEQTGILTYARAIEIIKKKIPDFEFLVVGDGKFKNSVSAIGKTIGFKENPEKYFKDYHCAFVSRYLSMLEAMVARRHIFAVYDNPIKKDYLEMSPFAKFISIINSPEVLAEKILYLLDHKKEEKELINNAFDWATKQTWEKVVQTYISLWEHSSQMSTWYKDNTIK